MLRRRLVQAGIYDPRGVAFFFLGRTALAVGLAFVSFLLLPLVGYTGGSFFWLAVMAGGVAGGPSIYIDKRISARCRWRHHLNASRENWAQVIPRSPPTFT
ncbi:MAG TPA: hypothetical protein VKP52_17920 [Pseudolabrys sp.]|nr:hypothetical protein [Pseudolabrys sp.]